MLSRLDLYRADQFNKDERALEISRAFYAFLLEHYGEEKARRVNKSAWDAVQNAINDLSEEDFAMLMGEGE